MSDLYNIIKRFLCLLLCAACMALPASALEPEIRSLDLNGSLGRLIVQPGDELRFEAGPKLAPYFHHEIRDGTLYCWTDFPGFSGETPLIWEQDYRITVTLPKEWGAFDEAVLRFGPGGGEAAQLHAKKLTVEGTGGLVVLSGLEADSLVLDGGTGGMALHGASAKEMLFASASGSLDADGLDAQSLRLDSGSGRVSITGKLCDVTAKTGTGIVSFHPDAMREDYALAVDCGSSLLLDGVWLREDFSDSVERAHHMRLDTSTGLVRVKFKTQEGE